MPVTSTPPERESGRRSAFDSEKAIRNSEQAFEDMASRFSLERALQLRHSV
jgi:hypothetical protein